MPGFITHFLCAEAALNRLPAPIRGVLNGHRQLYNIGAQGPDIFFFYLPGLFKKSAKNLGGDMHRANFSGFISAMLDEMTDTGSAPIFAYISGFLTHYALDSLAHPYVYSRIGRAAGEGKKGRLARGVRHRKFETSIDVLMLKTISGEKPAAWKLWRLIRTEADEAAQAAKAVSAAVKAAYGRGITQKDVRGAINHTVYITRLLQSRRGRRKRLIELAEKLTVGEHVLSSLIHPQEAGEYADCLNIAKEPWVVPGRRQTAVTSSFPELFEQAAEKAADLIIKTDLYRRRKNGEGAVPYSKQDLLAAIGNRSLLSGADSGGA